MKCLHLLVILLLLAVPAVAQKVGVLPPDRIVDLTYAFDANSVYWPTAEQFKLETDFEGMTDKGYFYSAYRYSAAEHGGTPIRGARWRIARRCRRTCATPTTEFDWPATEVVWPAGPTA